MYIIGKLFSITCILLCGFMASVFLEPGITWKSVNLLVGETAEPALSAKVVDKTPAPEKAADVKPAASELDSCHRDVAAGAGQPQHPEHPRSDDGAMLAALIPAQNRGSLVQSLESHHE